jgi:Sugar (and other) transporter
MQTEHCHFSGVLLPFAFQLLYRGGFLLYALIAVMALLFVCPAVPETKGEPLEEIENRALSPRSWL